MKRIRLELEKRRSFSFSDVLRFIWNFLTGFAAFAVEFIAATMLSLGSTSLKVFHWAVIGGFSFLAVVITYYREYRVTRSRERRVLEGKVVLDLLGGLIAQLNAQAQGSEEQKRAYLHQILRSIEKAVETVLREAKYPVGEICSNIMVLSPSSDSLSLEYFGTFKSGREKITLPVDCKHPLPGAAAAVCEKKVIYIENTLDPKYGGHFRKEKPYRSIISIPIMERPSVEDSPVVAVLNIDSDIADQFVSADFVSKRIVTNITPFSMLISTQEAVLVATGSSQDQTAVKH